MTVSPESSDAELNPASAMRHVLTVAEAANAVITEGGRRKFDQHAGPLLACAALFLAAVAKPTERLPRPDDGIDEEFEALFAMARKFAEQILPQMHGWLPPRKAGQRAR